MIKDANSIDETRLVFTPPKKLDNGKKRVVLTVDMVERGSRPYINQLYGYFIGSSMDFRAVQGAVRRLWRHYGFESMAKNGAGFYFFKFKDEKGLTSVLENGPWLIDQVPIFLHRWEPGLSLAKVEPKKVPVWIAIHDVPHDRWTGEGIGMLASAVGRPCLMDKATKERCLHKEGRISYARVLVELDAEEEVTSDIEVEYPPMRGRPGFISTLRVSYQWKPKHCSQCKVFGHNNSFHTPQVLTEVSKEAPKRTAEKNTHKDDGFKVVEKKNKGKKTVQASKAPPKTGTTVYRPKATGPIGPASKTPNPTSANRDGGKPSSPTRLCQLNTANRFSSLDDDDDDDDDDIEDVYEDDNPTGLFMRLEDEYC